MHRRNRDIEPKFLLGLLNSTLLTGLHKISLRAYQTAYMYVKKYIEQLPIWPINFINAMTKIDTIESLSWSSGCWIYTNNWRTRKPITQKQISSADRSTEAQMTSSCMSCTN